MRSLTPHERTIVMRFFAWYGLLVATLCVSVNDYVISVNADFANEVIPVSESRWRDGVASLLFGLSVVPLVLPGINRWARTFGVVYAFVGIGILWPLW